MFVNVDFLGECQEIMLDFSIFIYFNDDASYTYLLSQQETKTTLAINYNLMCGFCILYSV